MLFSPTLAGDATATLTIEVLDVSPKGGDIHADLYDRASYPHDDNPITFVAVPAKMPETVVTMTGLTPGTYAVKVFQDYNRNGEFDMNWLGLPLEKYGFSNDARPILSEPGFERTKFNLSPGANTIMIHLR